MIMVSGHLKITFGSMLLQGPKESSDSPSTCASKYTLATPKEISLLKYLNSWLIVHLKSGASYHGVLKAVDEDKNIVLTDAEGRPSDGLASCHKYLGSVCILGRDISTILWLP